MLVGTVEYKRQDFRIDRFDCKAVDISTTFMGKLTSGSYRAVELMAGNHDDDALWERRFDIGLSSVKVETKIFTNSSGKNEKAPVNYDFFCRLASIIRYAKHNCSKSNMLGYTGLNSVDTDFTPEVITTYQIPFECKEGYLGTISLKLGEICELHLETDDFLINLEQNAGVEEEVFYPIKNATPKGIQFNAEYLGFDVKPPVVITSASLSGFYTSLSDIIANHPDREYDWLLQNKYIIVSDDILDEVCERIINHKGYVFYDTETSGLNITFKSRLGKDQGDQLVGVVLTINDGEAYYFPTQMKSIPNLCNGDHFYFMEHYMKPILEGKELVAHNMSFDWKVAYIYDINANIVHDTMAIYKLTVGAEKKNFPMGLKELARIFLMRDSLELSDLVVDDAWGTSDVKFWDLPYELVRLYACADTDNTKGLFDNAMKNELLQKYNATRVYEIEIAFSYAVAYQEFYGHKIDTDNLETLHKELDRGLKENMDKMEKIVGYEFNPNSPKQLLQIMYQELGIPTQISRKTGRPTTDKDTLKYLSELTDVEGNVKYPFVKYLMDYRVFEGVRKIIDKFPELATSDGYLFSSVMQYGTTTGRVSINTPNYQSYNDPVKKNIIPRPGFWMFDTDYSSVEYRVLGNMANNQMIKEGFKDPDFDYHSYQAARMYNIPYASVTKKLRKAAKGINFGLPYGMGDQSLGVRVFGEESPENTRKAADLRAKYFKGQEDIRDFFDSARTRGVTEGFTETYFGRRRYYHKSDFSINAIKRQAGNQIIQGTAADIYKLAVGRVFKRICKEGWLGKVLLSGFIHDELLGEVHNSINPMKFLKALREEFEVSIYNEDGSAWCPLYMGYGFGMSWYEAKSVEIPIKLQWEFVEKYGEDGYPDWDGNGRKFCDTIPDKIRDFEIRDARKQLLDSNSQGKPIKPTLNNALFDILKADFKCYSECITDCLQEDYLDVQEMGEQDYLETHKVFVEKYLDEHCHIQCLYKEDDKYLLDLSDLQSKLKGTQDAIYMFCKLHDVDRSCVNILDIPEVSDNSHENLSTEIYLDDDEEDENEAVLQEKINLRVETLGLYLDVDKKQIILKIVPPEYMGYIKKNSSKEKKGYNIIFKDFDNKKTYMTDSYIKSEDVPVIQNMYLSYFKSIT